MEEEKKIWIVSEFYYPVLTSTGYYITEIAEFLATKKKNINVICTDSKYNENDNFNYVKKENRNGVLIHRIKSESLDKNNFLKRTIKLFFSSIKLFYKLFISVRKNDEILIVTNPAFLILLMPILKFFKGVNYKILVHDIFPENLVAIGKINKTSFINKFLKLWFDFSYSQAEKCIAIGRDMEEILLKKNVKPSNLCFIPNWADTDEVQPISKNQTNLINKSNLKDRFVFQFAGNLGHAQGIENILASIKLLSNLKIHFLFIGSGAMENKIKEFINNNPLNNVTHVGFQKRSEQNDFLNACDVAIVTLSDGMFGLGVPSKSYNIMATGKPILIIADDNSEISQCVKENNIGWVVKPNDPVQLKKHFELIYQEYVSNKLLNISNSREIALNFFSKRIILNKYFELF
jgi:glycosyltransferase involved in cell wall biosynthesis